MPAQTRIIHYYVCLGAAGGKEWKVNMNENFEYKIATREDIDAIVQFLARDYYETSRALKDPCKMIFLAYSGEVIVGILELLDLSNISFVYVSEDYQDTLVQEELLELAERFVTKELTAYTDEEHLSFYKEHYQDFQYGIWFFIDGHKNNQSAQGYTGKMFRLQWWKI